MEYLDRKFLQASTGSLLKWLDNSGDIRTGIIDQVKDSCYIVKKDGGIRVLIDAFDENIIGFNVIVG